MVRASHRTRQRSQRALRGLLTRARAGASLDLDGVMRGDSDDSDVGGVGEATTDGALPCIVRLSRRNGSWVAIPHSSGPRPPAGSTQPATSPHANVAACNGMRSVVPAPAMSFSVAPGMSVPQYTVPSRLPPVGVQPPTVRVGQFHGATVATQPVPPPQTLPFPGGLAHSPKHTPCGRPPLDRRL